MKKSVMKKQIVKNKITAHADGDFVYEDSISNESGFVIPATSIARGISVSSTLNNPVDIFLKPVEGIESSEGGMTNPLPPQATGSSYYTV